MLPVNGATSANAERTSPSVPSPLTLLVTRHPPAVHSGAALSTARPLSTSVRPSLHASLLSSQPRYTHAPLHGFRHEPKRRGTLCRPLPQIRRGHRGEDPQGEPLWGPQLGGQLGDAEQLTQQLGGGGLPRVEEVQALELGAELRWGNGRDVLRQGVRGPRRQKDPGIKKTQASRETHDKARAVMR